MENRERQDAFEQRKNEKLLREIARLQDTAREKTQWAGRAEARKIGSAPADRPDNYRSYQGAKAERAMARAKAIEKRREAALEEKKLLLKNLERREELKLVQLPFYTERLAELRNIRIAYGARTVCDSFGLSVRAGERIALQGPNGCGKSSILHLLCGMDVPHGGEVRRGSGLRISFVGQNTSGLCGSAAELAKACDIIIIGVKPDTVASVMEQIAPVYTPDKIIISMAAGISIRAIEDMAGVSAKVIRIMPNTPVMVGEGMTAIFVNDNITEEDKQTVYDMKDEDWVIINIGE